MFLSFNRGCLKKLKQIAKTIFDRNGHKFVFDNKELFGNGSVKYSDNGPMIARIGISGFHKHKNQHENFTIMLIVMYHEFKHIQQNETIRNGTSNIPFVYDAIAGFENRSYYIKNYKHSIRELDADSYGIHMAYNRLTKNHPEINAIQHIKTYMKTRLFYENYHDQIDQVKTIDDVNIILDKVFETLPDQRKSLDTTDDFVVLMDKYWTNTGINIRALLVQTENAIRELKEDDPERWQDLSINFLCDKTVTSFTLMNVPEYQIFFNNIKEEIPTPDVIVRELEEIINEKEEMKGLP